MNIYIYKAKDNVLNSEDISQIAKWHKCNGDKVVLFDSMEKLSDHAIESDDTVDCILFAYEQREWPDLELELRLLRAMNLKAIPFILTKFYGLHRKHIAYCDRAELNGVILEINDYRAYIDQFCQLSAKDVTFKVNWVANVKALAVKPPNNVVRIY